MIKKDAAEESGLDIISVLKTQQWETPWEVLEYVRGRWSIEFDACASPLNAIVPRYGVRMDSERPGEPAGADASSIAENGS